MKPPSEVSASDTGLDALLRTEDAPGKAIYLLCSSGRPMPVHQLHEILGIHYDTAVSMMRRVRYALDQATSLALDCRPTLDFHQTLEHILGAPPQGAIGRDASPAVAWSLGAP